MPKTYYHLALLGARVSALMLLGCVGAIGCASRSDLRPPPPSFYAGSVVDTSAPVPGSPPVDRQASDALQVLHTTTEPVDPNQKRWNVLALSGAGQYAAYAAGILISWRERGDCPDFDVYTGISSGAIVATLGCLGPNYHHKLENLLTTLKFSELFKLRPIPVNIIKYRSLSYPAGAIRIIEELVDQQMLADLAAMHQSGKRLFVGTMAIGQRRLVVWDIGAIASSCRPDRLELVRKILLASCSITGFVPPVPIQLTVNGCQYEELHGDAGAVTQVFLRFSEATPRPDPANPRAAWLSGSNLYVIAGGKLYADPLEHQPGFLTLATSTVSATLYGLFRADLWRLYAFCHVAGMKFHMIAIPDDKAVPSSSIRFDPVAERQLFEMGREFITAGRPWRLTPPGVVNGEEELPRSGTEFYTTPSAPQP